METTLSLVLKLIAIIVCSVLLGILIARTPAEAEKKTLAEDLQKAYDAGYRKAQIDKPKPPTPQACIAWFFETNLKEAKAKICHK